MYHFLDKCTDIGKSYYKRTDKELNFGQLYIAPALKATYIGKPASSRKE